MPVNSFIFLLSVLSIYRLSHMIVFEDGFFDVFIRMRMWIDSHANPNDWKVKGFHCILCVSFWLSLIPAIFFSENIYYFFLLWGGVSGGVLVLHKLSTIFKA